MLVLDSIVVDDSLAQFIREELDKGTFTDVNEMIYAGLGLLQKEEDKKQALIADLMLGEESGSNGEFNGELILREFEEKYNSYGDNNK